MIREDDSGIRNPLLDPHRAAPVRSDFIGPVGRHAETPTLPQRLRAEATRARDEHGNTDFYSLLREAATEFERLLGYVESETLRAEEAHGMTLRQSMEIENLQRKIHGVC